MKKSRLYTRYEESRFISVGFFVIIVIANILHFYLRGFDEIFIKVAMGSLGIFLLFEMIHFPSWYIPELKKQKAIKYGEVYVGKYYDIQRVSQFNISPSQKKLCYELQIEIEIDGRKEIVCRSLYYDNPGYYVIKNQECKVYKYKGKFYPEIIYYDSKAKNEDIFNNYVHEEELIIPHVKYIRNYREIGIHMRAIAIVNKPTYVYKMHLDKEIGDFMDIIRKERRIVREDEEVIRGIENIVRNELAKIDSIVEIKSINIHVY